MKQIAFFLLSITVIISAQSLINISAGPTWPKDLKITSETSTAWNASFEYGRVFNKRYILGAKVDLLWDIGRVLSPTDSDSVVAKSQLYMFPLSAFFQFDPFPQYRLHPVAHVQIGYNSMVIKHNFNDDPLGENAIRHPEGYYLGVQSKVGADMVFDLGKNGALFGGFEYQWSRLNRNNIRINMNAPSFRFGISILY